MQTSRLCLILVEINKILLARPRYKVASLVETTQHKIFQIQKIIHTATLLLFIRKRFASLDKAIKVRGLIWQHDCPEPLLVVLSCKRASTLKFIFFYTILSVFPQIQTWGNIEHIITCEIIKSVSPWYIGYIFFIGRDTENDSSCQKTHSNRYLSAWKMDTIAIKSVLLEI